MGVVVIVDNSDAVIVAGWVVVNVTMIDSGTAKVTRPSKDTTHTTARIINPLNCITLTENAICATIKQLA